MSDGIILNAAGERLLTSDGELKIGECATCGCGLTDCESGQYIRLIKNGPYCESGGTELVLSDFVVCECEGISQIYVIDGDCWFCDWEDYEDETVLTLAEVQAAGYPIFDITTLTDAECLGFSGDSGGGSGPCSACDDPACGAYYVRGYPVCSGAEDSSVDGYWMPMRDLPILSYVYGKPVYGVSWRLLPGYSGVNEWYQFGGFSTGVFTYYRKPHTPEDHGGVVVRTVGIEGTSGDIYSSGPGGSRCLNFYSTCAVDGESVSGLGYLVPNEVMLSGSPTWSGTQCFFGNADVCPGDWDYKMHWGGGVIGASAGNCSHQDLGPCLPGTSPPCVLTGAYIDLWCENGDLCGTVGQYYWRIRIQDCGDVGWIGIKPASVSITEHPLIGKVATVNDDPMGTYNWCSYGAPGGLPDFTTNMGPSSVTVVNLDPNFPPTE